MIDLEEIRGAHQQARDKETCRYCRFHWPCHPIRLADELDRYVKRFGPLTEDPEPDGPRPPSFYDHPRWGCGCDGTGCKLRMEVGRDASPDPSQVVRVLCMTHGIYGDSDCAKEGGALRQREQAMQRLDLAHQEQCR